MRFLSCGVGQMRSNISEIDRIYGSDFENILLPIILPYIDQFGVGPHFIANKSDTGHIFE